MIASLTSAKKIVHTLAI